MRQDYVEAGWSDVVLCDSRPDNFYSLNLMGPEGRKEPSKAQAKALAVREAVATNPALALDVLLHTLLQSLVFDSGAHELPLSIKPESRGVRVDEDLMVQSEIRSVQDKSAKDIGALSQDIRLPDIVAMKPALKQKLLGYLVASQIDAGGCYNGTGISHINAAQIDLKARWQPSVAFFSRISKPTLLKILREQCGNAAADNCAGMTKDDLALAMADRLAGKNWLPPALIVKRGPQKDELEQAA